MQERTGLTMLFADLSRVVTELGGMGGRTATHRAVSGSNCLYGHSAREGIITPTPHIPSLKGCTQPCRIYTTSVITHLPSLALTLQNDIFFCLCYKHTSLMSLKIEEKLIS